jgi:hypothetical protein
VDVALLRKPIPGSLRRKTTCADLVGNLAVFHVEKSAANPIKKEWVMITKIVVRRQQALLRQPNFIEHPPEVDEIADLRVSAAQTFDFSHRPGELLTLAATVVKQIEVRLHD